MPNTQSAIRRAKKTKLQTAVNKVRKGKYRSAIKQMNNYLSSNILTFSSPEPEK